ncbi:hypothetical protein B5K05_13275 [Rhizobium phaseoli]|uniref:AAA family ATPase n=1 Tax=Rhizobium phaseoli TaxID=396 RepID=UPI000E0D99A3|nr:MoxR family ATPase [Rhizobium phaseoli]RDJ10101.1 hypothetical protein B5K04_13250 [Rhizobium phaseoli]RDJ14101.1 hypothetical protein B5K05_13275 [Rhizobium phaseoli]
MWFNSFSAVKEPPAPSESTTDRFAGKGSGYVFSEDLEAAIDVAIGLGRPLLVSGEPGSGKTELGYAIARRLGIDRVQFFSTKSTSEARDLFYTYDAIGRFRDAQIAQTQGGRLSDVGDYIEFQALGRAILDSHHRADIAHLLRGRNRYEHPGQPTRSIVIIDEIDKAARDFPNDFLREIEDLSFRIVEFARSADDAPDSSRPETPSGALLGHSVRPIIIVTSNEERQLPDAFLRRCIFHEITFPSDDVLARIIASGLERRMPPGDGAADRFVLPAREANALIELLRQFRNLPLEKKPGVAELIDAATLMAYPSQTKPPPFEDRKKKTIAALAKLKLDRDTFADLIGGAVSSP